MEEHVEQYNWHGLLADPKWPVPELVAHSNEANRADQGNTIKANEYMDSPDVLESKMEFIANLIKQSEMCTVYSGAGISKASGIPDYATKAKNSVVQAPKLQSSLDAQPTYAHCVLTALERAGYLKHWVQQNHDGLPQKAGFPQEKINEIHGAWFDPSNPVVQFSGKLRSDLFYWLTDMEQITDLCLCLGTSLSGMNADRIASTTAQRSLEGAALGTIIINLQKTRLDHLAAIRVWAKLDDAFSILVGKLGLGEIKPLPATLPPGDVYVVPYDAEGRRNNNCQMTLDLRRGSEVVIPVKGAMNYGVAGRVAGKREGHYSIELNEPDGVVRRLLGSWWVDAAMRGAVDYLPIVNSTPVIQYVGSAP